jgi:hypothetical protein
MNDSGWTQQPRSEIETEETAILTLQQLYDCLGAMIRDVPGVMGDTLVGICFAGRVARFTGVMHQEEANEEFPSEVHLEITGRFY